MGYTLDQLLDETGVTKLAGARSNKTAAEKFSFSKLASRCRKAAEATPEEKANSAHQDLAEKTAQVEIIRHTMAEIDAIMDLPDHGQTKVASPQPRQPHIEEFIKMALDAGHSAEDIATFLQKTGGIWDRIGGRFQEFRATRALKKSHGLTMKADAAAGKGIRRWEDRLRNASRLGEQERNALVSRMRVEIGDENTASLVSGSAAFKDLPSAKGLKKPPTPGATGPTSAGPQHAIGVNIGGTSHGITAEQLKKYKTPAMAAGAGVLVHRAMTRPKEEGGGKKKGVVIING